MESSMVKRTKMKLVVAGDNFTLTMVVPRLFRQKPLLMRPQLVDLARDTQRRNMRER